MPTITLPTVAALAASGVLSGIGSGIAADSAADAQKDAAKEAAMGPIRGGTARAGNQGQVSLMPNKDALAKLGQTAIPMQNPVYGGQLDINQLYKPQAFGAGYSLNQNMPNVPKRF